MSKDITSLFRSTMGYTMNGSIAISIAIFTAVIFGLYMGQPDAINTLLYNSVDFVLLFTFLCVFSLPLLYFIGIGTGILSKLVLMSLKTYVKFKFPNAFHPQFTPKIIHVLRNKEATHGTR